jgi:esterase/lipase superfamily enzyme
MKNAFLILFLMLTSALKAEHIVLHSAQVTYDTVIQELKENDIIEFSNQKKFRLGRRLDTLSADSEKGSQTLIFELKDYPEYVIRIPNEKALQRGINQTLLGYKKIEFLGPSVVKIIDGLENEYAIVEKLPDNHITFLELIINESFAEELQNKMVNALLRFVKKTAIFSEIGDFNLTQITYDIHKDAWVLFDWNDQHSYISHKKINKSSSFSWKSLFSGYLDDHFWKDEDLDAIPPELTPEQREKVRRLSILISEVADKERMKIISKLKNKKSKRNCMVIFREFL